MTKKEYLRQGYRMRKEIRSEEDMLKELGENLDGLQALQNSEKLQGGPIKDDRRIIEKIDKIIKIEEEIKIKLLSLKSFQAKLYQEIELIQDLNQRILLKNRYIFNLTWEQIAERLGYSMTQTHRIHRAALGNFKFFKMVWNGILNVLLYKI